MTRPLMLLAFGSVAAGLAFAFASCDSGGEPPEQADTGVFFDVGTTIDSPTSDSILVGDSGNPETSSGDDAPDQEDVVVDAGPCGMAHIQCCAGSTCTEEGYACAGDHKCTECGGAGEICCGLNTCDDGGCCTGSLCTPQGGTCTLADAAVCMGGACGRCGSEGQPCCGTTCTAPQTVCQLEDGSGECAQCGKADKPCCEGSSCASGLTCSSGFCQ